jgi:hypothetical protein
MSLTIGTMRLNRCERRDLVRKKLIALAEETAHS